MVQALITLAPLAAEGWEASLARLLLAAAALCRPRNLGSHWGGNDASADSA
jgi:hypothetical protein